MAICRVDAEKGPTVGDVDRPTLDQAQSTVCCAPGRWAQTVAQPPQVQRAGAGGGVVPGAGVFGSTVSGREARPWAAGSVGRYKGPRWPQAAKAAVQTARAMHLTRIWGAFNMSGL